jgi:hypothetical protein
VYFNMFVNEMLSVRSRLHAAASAAAAGGAASYARPVLPVGIPVVGGCTS